MIQQQNTKANPYLTQKVLTASPEQLIAYVYDFGVVACKQKNSIKARRAVQTLMSALNFEAKDAKKISETFFNVYRHLNFLINNQKFSQAGDIFSELKVSWSNAFGVH